MSENDTNKNITIKNITINSTDLSENKSLIETEIDIIKLFAGFVYTVGALFISVSAKIMINYLHNKIASHISDSTIVTTNDDTINIPTLDLSFIGDNHNIE